MTTSEPSTQRIAAEEHMKDLETRLVEHRATRQAMLMEREGKLFLKILGRLEGRMKEVRGTQAPAGIHQDGGP